MLYIKNKVYVPGTLGTLCILLCDKQGIIEQDRYIPVLTFFSPKGSFSISFDDDDDDG